LENLEEDHKKEMDESTRKWKEKIAKAEVGRLCTFIQWKCSVDFLGIWLLITSHEDV